jgi:hypothetical protein
MTASDSIDLVDSLTALSRLWHEVNDSREHPQPFHVSVSPSDSKALLVQADPDTDGFEVVVSHLDLSLLTELGYVGAMQWKGDYSVLYLTPEGVDFAAAGDEPLREQRRQQLINKLDERQGRTS